MIVTVYVYALAISIAPLLGWGNYKLEGFLITCTYDFITPVSGVLVIEYNAIYSSFPGSKWKNFYTVCLHFQLLLPHVPDLPLLLLHHQGSVRAWEEPPGPGQEDEHGDAEVHEPDGCWELRVQGCQGRYHCCGALALQLGALRHTLFSSNIWTDLPSHSYGVNYSFLIK